jgi:hypothetical protein
MIVADWTFNIVSVRLWLPPNLAPALLNGGIIAALGRSGIEK